MADKSKIEWTDATWNPITGCSVVSPGCTNCYAMRLAGTRLRNHPTRKGLTIDSKAGPVWNGEVRLNRSSLSQPLRWKAPRMIFVCAHGDLFHESVPDEWIDRVFAIMALCPQHTFQVLTKRAARMREYLTAGTTARRIYELACDLVIANEIQVVLVAPGMDESFAPAGRRVYLDVWPMPNVWLGVSIEDQARAEERIPFLLHTPAAIRFASAEPLLGSIDLTSICTGHYFIDALRGAKYHDAPESVHGAMEPCPLLDQIIVGGESGSGARPMHPDWARQLRNDCLKNGTAFFFKQWGAFRPLTDPERGQACGATRIGDDPYDRDSYVLHVGKRAAGRLLDGIEHNGMPGNWESSI